MISDFESYHGLKMILQNSNDCKRVFSLSINKNCIVSKPLQDLNQLEQICQQEISLFLVYPITLWAVT